MTGDVCRTGAASTKGSVMEYGWVLVRMIVVLAAVCGLAYALLRWGVRRLVPFDPSHSGRLEVMERVGVAPKQSLFVVRTGDQFWLVGSSEAGLELISQLDGESWQSVDQNSDQA